MVISTSRVNSYGSRVITEGIDLSQYVRNPILLWMHCRQYPGERAPLPIGRVENLRTEGDALIGTPVFDSADEFARQIESKWENGFLKMCSAGIEILETSADMALIVPGQTRATITRCKLVEVSIVDIGANDDALQLMHEGRELRLAAGAGSEVLPLLNVSDKQEQRKLAYSAERRKGRMKFKLNMTQANADGTEPEASNNNKQFNMKKETLVLLGLADDASEQQVHEAVQLLKGQADKVKTMELAAITQCVETAIKEKRVTEAKRDHFVELGKKVGVDSLRETLELMQPTVKPTDVIQQQAGANGAPAAGQQQTFTKLSEVPEDKVMELKEQNPELYARLYRAEYGVDLDV